MRAPSYFSRQGASKHIHFDLDRSGQHDLASGQGHVMTQEGHAACLWMRRGEIITMGYAHVSGFFRSYLTSETLFVTSSDPRWPDI